VIDGFPLLVWARFRRGIRVISGFPLVALAYGLIYPL
jgi:hypothetical protein